MITTDILYQISCDNCGKAMHNHKGGHWFKTEFEALATTAQYGWKRSNDKHYCPECRKQLKRKK